MSRVLLTPIARARRWQGRLTGDDVSPLDGRRVMITGASSGIGAATAHLVAQRGATVLLVARRANKLARVRAAIEARGGRANVHVYVCDLTDGPAVEVLTQRVIAEHGGVDYLVNNAGRSIRRSLDLSYERFHDVERTMAVNYFGAVRLTLALLPGMRAQRFGHVVNVTSWGVQKKQPKFAAYLASKAALDTWGRIAGRETYADGVTFTSVRFGLVLTSMVESVPDVHTRRSLSPEQAAARVVRALEDRPVTLDQFEGRVAEVVNIVAPRLSDAWMNRHHRTTPDSPAARGL